MIRDAFLHTLSPTPEREDQPTGGYWQSGTRPARIEPPSISMPATIESEFLSTDRAGSFFFFCIFF